MDTTTSERYSFGSLPMLIIAPPEIFGGIDPISLSSAIGCISQANNDY